MARVIAGQPGPGNWNRLKTWRGERGETDRKVCNNRQWRARGLGQLMIWELNHQMFYQAALLQSQIGYDSFITLIGGLHHSLSCLFVRLIVVYILWFFPTECPLRQCNNHSKDVGCQTALSQCSLSLFSQWNTDRQTPVTDSLIAQLIDIFQAGLNHNYNINLCCL